MKGVIEKYSYDSFISNIKYKSKSSRYDPCNTYGFSYGGFINISYYPSNSGGGSGDAGGGSSFLWGAGIFIYPPINEEKTALKSDCGEAIMTGGSGSSGSSSIAINMGSGRGHKVCNNGRFINGECVRNIDSNDDDQIFNELTGKADCVYKKLESTSTGFKNAIKKFDGEFPVSHLKLEESTNLSSNVNAETSPPASYLITITLNSNNLNRPNLSIARTIIHEVIHAEMFRKILSIIDNGGDLNGLTRSQWTNKLSNGDYPGIFDYYSRYGVNGMQHQQMASHYISTISNYLKSFQPGLSQDVYDSMAWTGLKNTTAWNSLSPSKKTEITNTVNAFNNNGSENCN